MGVSSNTSNSQIDIKFPSKNVTLTLLQVHWKKILSQIVIDLKR